MLKVYDVKSYVSIDGEPWQPVGIDGYTFRDDDPIDKVIFEDLTFEQCYQYVQEHYIDGIWLSKTFFKKKPLIYIGESCFNSYRYDSFNTISYRHVYTERRNVTFDWIMKHASAEQCIQYLKERGMTACPIKGE